MKRLGSHTGYLQIDHRDSPGLSPSDVAHVPDALPVGPGQVLERDVKQCTHCQRTVVLNPGRVRERAVCPKCYHYICDNCDVSYRLTNICGVKVFDQAVERAVKFVGQPDHPEAAIDPVAHGTETAPTVTVPDVPRIVLTDP